MSLVNEFLTDTVASTTLPYTQIISPPNIRPQQLQKGGFEIGFFIKKEQAELAEFTPDESWIPYEASLGSGTEVGFICPNPKFVIIHKSGLEIQNLDENGRWRFLGLGYENGQETIFRQQAKTAPQEHRQVVRHLLLFLGKDDQPLHQTPIQWSAKGGLNGALYEETKAFYTQLSKVFFAEARKNGQKVSGSQLSPFALAFGKIDISLTWCKLPDAAKAPFCVPGVIKMPTIENVGNDLEVIRRDRKVIFRGISLSDAMISKSSAAGQLIINWYQEYSDFPKPRRNLATFDDVGRFENHQYLPSGEVKCLFAGKEVVLPASLEYVVHTNGMYRATGVVDGAFVSIKNVEPFDDGFSPTGVEVPDPAMGSGDDDDFGYPPY